MNDYKSFADILDANIQDILVLLPTQFTAMQFIEAFRSIRPVEYANILSGRTYQSLNVWISRWYLQGLSERGQIAKVDRKQPIVTTNGNKSRNQVWRRHWNTFHIRGHCCSRLSVSLAFSSFGCVTILPIPAISNLAQFVSDQKLIKRYDIFLYYIKLYNLRK